MGQIRWSELGRAARAFRIAHGAFSIVQLAALGYVWHCALRRRRSRTLALAAAALLTEGGALVLGRGDCPLGGFQARLGDPVPLFELVLPRRAARAAIPLLAVVAGLGLAAVVLRPPRIASASPGGASQVVPWDEVP